MSWSGYGTFRYDNAEQGIADIAVSPDSDNPDQIEQVKAAKEAILALVKSSAVVNDVSQDVAVSLTGHANPGHKPTTGYANDMITVTLSQVTRSETAA